MIGPETRTFQGRDYLTYKVVTDAGSILRLSQHELEELFHPAEWVMEQLLPAHQQALEEENHGAEI